MAGQDEPDIAGAGQVSPSPGNITVEAKRWNWAPGENPDLKIFLKDNVPVKGDGITGEM